MGHHVNMIVSCLQRYAISLCYLLRVFWATQLEILWIQSENILVWVHVFDQFLQPPFGINSARPHFIRTWAISLQIENRVVRWVGIERTLVKNRFELGTKKMDTDVSSPFVTALWRGRIAPFPKSKQYDPYCWYGSKYHFQLSFCDKMLSICKRMRWGCWEWNESVSVLIQQQRSHMSMHALRERNTYCATCSHVIRKTKRTKIEHIHHL